jgi:endonuclease/exonuclease/phosphatase family metal-dependent hydrolase
MKIKILSLNIWNYHGFSERKPKIVALIKKYDPDVVVFQEVRDDRSKNDPSNNQLEQLNQALEYEYSYFLPVQNFKERKKLEYDCIEGLGICSKFPFEKHFFELQKHADDVFTRKVLQTKVTVNGTVFNISNVHFSPNDVFAKLHLEEVVRVHANKPNTIIIGDLNYPHKKEISKISEAHKLLSSSNFEYISFPDDNCSYDYILMSKDLKFQKFECVEEKVSDHNAIFSEIIL